MMFKVGVVSMVVLTILYETEVSQQFLPQVSLYGQLHASANPKPDYGKYDQGGLTRLRQTLYTGLYPTRQFPQNEQFRTERDDSNSIYNGVSIENYKGVVKFPAKRAFYGFPDVSKRIRTCALIRRMGLPMGLCFKGSRSRVNQRLRIQEDGTPEQDAYAYLERQWPVHSMLGGGIGK